MLSKLSSPCSIQQRSWRCLHAALCFALPVVLVACGQPPPKQAVNIDNTTITNSTVTIVQILGGVGDIPSAGSTTYEGLMAKLGESPDAIQAKMHDLLIGPQGWVRSFQVRPSFGGFRASGEYHVRIQNSSSSVAYNFSGFASLLGQYSSPGGNRFVIPSETAGRIESNTLCLTPGQSGELVFTFEAPVQDILDKAGEQGVPMHESNIHAVFPNDGIAWRPSVDRYAGLRVQRAQQCQF